MPELESDDIYQDHDFTLSASTASSELADLTVQTFMAQGVFEQPSGPLPARLNNKKRAFQYKDAERSVESHAPPADKTLGIVDNLPATKSRGEVLSALDAQVVIISGETGSGKSTQVPKFVLDSNRVKGLVVVTQPRRISATSVARRVAQERRCRVGAEVGYHVRFERLASPETRLLFVTTGVLLRMLQSEPLLSAVGCVIVDEVHERDADTDFSLMILKRLLSRRPQFKLMLMSATLSAEKFRNYFSDYSPRTVHISGRTFNVHQKFLDEILPWVGLGSKHVEDKNLVAAAKLVEQGGEGGSSAAPDATAQKLLKSLVQQGQDVKVDCEVIACIIRRIISEPRSRPSEAILVFMPGWKEIATLKRILQNSTELAPKVLVLPCHSDMKSEDQNKVFARPPHGLRKVVIATNIAETSVTIPDVVHVIDTAIAKSSSYTAYSDIMSLGSALISQANIQQRKGRAGRVQAGHCYTLITRTQHRALDPQMSPELTRIPLHQTCLQLSALLPGCDLHATLKEALDPPSEEAVDRAINFLTKQGALTADREMTNMGKVLAMLPVDPLLGKLLLYGAAFGVLRPVCIIAAFLSVKSPFVRVLPVDQPRVAEVRHMLGKDEYSDHTMLLHLYETWQGHSSHSARRDFCSSNYIDHNAMNRVDRTVTQFLSIVRFSGFLRGQDESYFNRHSANTGLVRGVVFAGLYPNVAWVGEAVSVKTGRREGRSRIVTLDGKPVQLTKDSVNNRLGVRNLEELGLSYVAYYDRLLLEKTLVLSDSTMFGPVPLLVFATNVTWNTGDAHASALIEGQWRRLRMSLKDAKLLQSLRHLTSFFFRKALERVQAASMPDQVVRSFAEVIGYPTTGDSITVFEVEVSSDEEDGGVAETADEPEFVPACFVVDDSDSDSGDDVMAMQAPLANYSTAAPAAGPQEGEREAEGADDTAASPEAPPADPAVSTDPSEPAPQADES
eukprot:TRINITY_DN21567_c1_g1_i2.p1 TRINITY_DN21567_c1_g1~~TRINITY_DN21567_c1_g1_i2.p1  ORF type:complete len:960 (+),score=372.29 TRINITY_DN21567_c1_g1_i2:308-3187(+)